MYAINNSFYTRNKSLNTIYRYRITQVLSSSWDGWLSGHNRRRPKIGWRLCPFWGRAESPPSTMWPGLRPSSVPCDILIHQPFGHNRHGLKIGGLCPFFLGGGPGRHLTQCGLNRGLPPC